VGKKHIQVNEFIQLNFPQVFDFQNNIQIQIHDFTKITFNKRPSLCSANRKIMVVWYVTCWKWKTT